MNRKEVKSSNIKSVGWEDKVLEIEFHSGGIYQYKPVGETIYTAFLESESKGKYFFQYIKGQFECEKMEPDYTVKQMKSFDSKLCHCGENDSICKKDLKKELDKYIALYEYDDGKDNVKCCRNTVIAFIKYLIA